jgi:hypothetical protein
MMRRIAAAAALILLLPALAAAQDLVSLCERARHPAVGAWSEFKWVGGRNDGATIRMSIVGKERREGADYLWMEIVMRDFPMGSGRQQAEAPRRMISKMLVPGFGAGAGSPRAAIIKLGDLPAMEMPVGQSRMGAQGAPNLEACQNAKVVGWESVTVPAGTFRAIHIVGANGRGDSWVAPNLPFALVKEVGNDEGQSRQMVLIAHGMGARSLITERPQPFDPRLFAEMMSGRRPAPKP